MKRLGLVILLLAMVAVSIGFTAQMTAPRQLTEADRATFARANQLVEAGQVAAAVNLYEQLSAQGIVNADLFYNLGQAYSQLGKTNQASEYYARAAQLAPRDGQIAERLKQAGVSTRSVVPLTTNELMLGALLLASMIAVLFVGRRRGLLARRTAETSPSNLLS
jgi:tetratricopeptide (TPR) repeat protein